MRLTKRFTAALIVGIVLVHAVSAALRVERERRLFKEDIARDAKLLGWALGHAIERTWRTHGEAEAQEIVDYATDSASHVDVRLVSMAAPTGDRAPRVPHDLLEPLERGEPAVVRDGPDGGTLYTYVPVRLPDQRMAIEIADPLADEERYLTGSILGAASAALVLVAICAGLAWILGISLIGRPVARLVEQARAIGRGGLDRRLALPIRDELGELAREMDQMCENLQEAQDRAAAEARSRIAANQQLRHADRLTTVGTLASGIAHELGTPINVIEGHAQLIREDPREVERVHEHAELISAQCARMTDIIRQLLDFARRGSPGGASSDLGDVARETLRMMEPLLQKRDVEAELEVEVEDGEAVVGIGFNEMQQVLINIVINSLQAMPEGGRLCLRVERSRAPDSGPRYAALSIEDTGAGMEPETLARIFEPFFTTKPVGEGTGLGLSVAYGIIDDRGGWIDVVSEPGCGSTFTIHLPVERAP